MIEYAKEELLEALRVVSSTISKCEKAQLKFAEGTSQYSLLKNRIKAMYISKALLTGEGVREFTQEELLAALPPVSSIISKCEKGQEKYAEGSVGYNKLKKIIVPMYISKALILKEISKRG